MKKSVRITLIVTAVCIALIASFFTVTFFALRDKISNSEKNLIDKTMLFTHNTEKGEKLEIPFSCGLEPVGEGTYLVDLLLNSDQNSENYGIKNARVKLNINNNVDILSAFYSAEGSDYTAPIQSYDDSKEIECFSDCGYVHLQMLLSGEEAKNLNMTVEYDVTGEGLYSFNKFHQTWEDVEFKL